MTDRSLARAGSLKVRLTDRDRQLLAFMAEHRIVLGAHVERALSVSRARASARLAALASAGYVRRDPWFHRQAACHQITRQGLAAIESDLPVPRTDLRSYRHDIGTAWLWLAAHAGTFGALRAVVSERRMRSHDGSEQGRAEPFAVRLGGLGRGGGDCLHYPDLLLEDLLGRRFALELELTSKPRARREKILGGYAADARIGAVLYLSDNPAVRREVSASARRLGISYLIGVQRVSWEDRTTAPTASSARHTRVRSSCTAAAT